MALINVNYFFVRMHVFYKYGSSPVFLSCQFTSLLTVAVVDRVSTVSESLAVTQLLYSLVMVW